MTTHWKGHTVESAWEAAALLTGNTIEEFKYICASEGYSGGVYRSYQGKNGWLSVLSKERYEVNLDNGNTVILWIKEAEQ